MFQCEEFLKIYKKKALDDRSIKRWFHNFTETGRVTDLPLSGTTRASKEVVESLRAREIRQRKGCTIRSDCQYKIMRQQL